MAYKNDFDLQFLEKSGNDELRILFNSLIYYRKKSIKENFEEYWERVITESDFFYNKNTTRTTYRGVIENIAEELMIEKFQDYFLEELEEQIFKKVFLLISFSFEKIEKMVFEPETEENELKNRIFLHKDISLERISLMYLGYVLRNYTERVIPEFLISPFMIFINKNLEEKGFKLKTRLIISFIVLVAILRRVRKAFDKKETIENNK